MHFRTFIFALGAIIAGTPTLASAQTFQEALAAAYRSNPSLLAERERVKEADELWVQARALGRPSSNASISVAPTGVRVPNSSFADPLATGNATDLIVTRQAGVEIIQPIYQGGRIRSQKNQAKAAILAAREGLRSAEQAVLQQAANAYVDVLRDEEAARIRRNNVSVLIRQQEAANVRFDVGAGTRTDIAQADTRLAQARIGLAQAEASLQASRAAFTRVIGFQPESLSTAPRVALPATLDEAIEIAQTANPQLLASYFNEQIAEASIGVAKSTGKPSVSLNGSVGLIREGLGGLTRAETASVTAQLVIPIFAGGANESSVRQAKNARNRASFETRDLERAIRQNVTQLWSQIEAADISIDAARSQVSSAEVAFEGVELEQQVGTRTALDVLDAEQELLNARLNVLDAERARDQATFQLLTILGAFDVESLQLPVENYDPRDHFETVRRDPFHDLFGGQTDPIEDDFDVITLRDTPLSDSSDAVIDTTATPIRRSRYGD